MGSLKLFQLFIYNLIKTLFESDTLTLPYNEQFHDTEKICSKLIHSTVLDISVLRLNAKFLEPTKIILITLLKNNLHVFTQFHDTEKICLLVNVL